MSPWLVALAVVVVTGGVLSVSARDGKLATVGLLAVLALAPLVASPLPDVVAASARVVAAALATYLVGIPLRSAPPTRGSRIGWPAEALAASAGFVAGVTVGGFGAPGLGPAAGVGAGLALIALAVAPLAETRDLLRQGLGLFLLVTGAELVRSGLAGTPSALEALALAGVVVALGAAVALLATRSVATTGDLEIPRAERPER